MDELPAIDPWPCLDLRDGELVTKQGDGLESM